MEDKSQKRRRTEKSNKTQKVLITVTTILLILAVLFGTYYFTSNGVDSKYISAINVYKKNVDKINSDAANETSKIADLDLKNTEEVGNLISAVTESSSSMQKLLNDLNTFNPPSKYKEQFGAFKTGVELNYKIFSQTALILRSPTNKDINTALDKLDKYVSDTSKAYDTSKLKKFYVTLPNEILALPGKISGFATKAYNDYSAKERLLEQYTSYISSMEKVNSDIKAAAVNLNSNFDSIQSGQKNIGDVYVDVDKKMSSISSIKDSYDKITAPSKLANQHKKLSNIIKSYVSYCQQFKTTLTDLEEAGNDAQKVAALGEDIDSLEIQYTGIQRALDDYIYQFDNDKYFYEDINNL